ncbi:MAG: nucleotidyltransferase family protein [Clostridia bacterium]|nr:nucleotidyltransferase family protein [Clostridia bacterium]
MTQNTAIICETNPFHRGHKYLFDTVKAQTDGIVTAVMSGNFVQRGIPAVLDKYKRAEILLSSGADLVVELPYPWCAAGGEAFAAGGIAVAAGMGADTLAFGSETGEADMLAACAAWLDSAEYQEKMLAAENAEPETGAAALHDRLTREAGYFLAPNDKLAVWYLRQIRAQKAGMTPAPLKRTPHTETVISATKIREKLVSGEVITPYVPEETAEIYQHAVFTDSSRFADMAWTYFRLFAPQDPLQDGETGGLYRRLVKTAGQSTSGEQFFTAAATKKYTDARIRRAALFAMTGTPSPDTLTVPAYTVLLAASEKGRAWLKARRKTADFPIITKPADCDKLPEEAKAQYAWLRKADSLYAMCMHPAESADFFLRKHPAVEK